MGRSAFRKLILALALAVAAGVLPLYAYKVWLKTDYTDFTVYYRAASRVRSGLWDEIYTLKDGASPLRYAPLTLPLLRPLAEMSEAHARLLWYFLQYGWFMAGFALIAAALKRAGSQAPWTAAAFSALFITRFCLDCFTIGQISSLLFLGFCASLYFWAHDRHGRASLALLLPSVFKIGPAIAYPLLLKGRPRERSRAVIVPSAALLAWAIGAGIWVGSVSLYRKLWSGWLEMVRMDSVYYDASHYGSQSVKSFLLRLAHWGWIGPGAASLAYLLSAILICGIVLFFWSLRKPRGEYGRALFFALGIFPYLWVMPETFKYSLTALAIPAALLLEALYRREIPLAALRRCAFALAFGALVLSLAGKDIVGDLLFFGLQKYSIPLLATVLLGAACIELCWRYSDSTRFARALHSLLTNRAPGPWESEIPSPSVAVSLLAPLPIDPYIQIDVELAEKVLIEADRLLSSRTHGSYEILIEPYGDLAAPGHPLLFRMRELGQRHSGIRLGQGSIRRERSLALRRAFLASRGRSTLFLHLEQPCDVEFYSRALDGLEKGDFALIRGNRRHAESRFKIPVRLLNLVYGRHRMGLAFNRLVRWLLPIETTDTHSGILAMSRELAADAFALQSSADFLFDLELSLVAKTHGYREKDLPLTLFLGEEKQKRRMLFETLSICLGLPGLRRRYRQGYYSPLSLSLSQKITADDWGLSPGVNQGILELARRGVIRRVSVMARSRFLTRSLVDLQAIPGVDLGLHFDLTYGRSGPASFMLRWLLGSGDRVKLRESVRAEFQSQLEALRAQGIQPRYVDGHHHIHLTPGLMTPGLIDALADLIQAAGIRQVRLPYDPGLWFTPKAPLNLLSLLARSKLRKNGFEWLPCFYPQSSHFRDFGKLRAGLSRNRAAEVIVHPSEQDDFAAHATEDPYTAGRVLEFHALRMLSSHRLRSPE